MKTTVPRKDFLKRELNEVDVPESPFALFSQWWSDALQANALMPDAMVLSTIDQDLKPDARVVFLKDFDESGFVFFTNYLSTKGMQLGLHPEASLTFFWPELERQVRIRGKAEKCSLKESETYFKSRPRGAQIGAWASTQSQVIASREVLESIFEKFSNQFVDVVDCPPHWGGYRLKPDSLEFWQGRANRLHDRFRYRLIKPNTWLVQRLAP